MYVKRCEHRGSRGSTTCGSQSGVARSRNKSPVDAGLSYDRCDSILQFILSKRARVFVSLSDPIRSEPFPNNFKEHRKVTNYEPNMDPVSWLSSYEMD